jgi:uncharacterized protein (TIGR00369 family)
MHRLKGLPPLSPEKRAWLKTYEPSPIFGLLGIRLVKFEPGFALLEMPVKPEHTHNGGIVQGGVITSLADSAIAYAVTSALPEGSGQTSIDLKINFIRPVSAGRITAEGWLIHLGSRTAVGEAIVLNADGKAVAKCLSSVLIMPTRQWAREGRPRK